MWGSIDFEFQIEVINEPPYFVKQPSDRYIMQDTSVVFSLPAHKDEEGQPVTVNIVEASKQSMPTFLTFYQNTLEFRLSPTSKTLLGQYSI